MHAFLNQHDACSEGAAFAREFKTLSEAWDACERPDWLLWAYCRKVKTPDSKQLRLFACWCARQNWHLLTDERSRKAVEVAEAYANGLATTEELTSARRAADAAAAYAAYAYAAAKATYAYAAAADAADAAAAYAYAAARRSARKAQAAQLKTMIPNPFL